MGGALPTGGRPGQRAGDLQRIRSSVVPATFLLFIGSLGLFPLMSVDIGVHLTAGRYTLEHGIPETNVFSAINEQHPILQHEWLFQVFTHVLAAGLGLQGLVLVRLLLVLAMGVVLWRAVPAGGSASQSALCLSLGFFVASPRFVWRPELLTLLLAAVVLKILVDFIEERRDRLAWLVLVQLVWVNVHGYFIVGLILVAAVGCGELLAAVWSRRPLTRGWRVLGMGALAAAACFVNPYFHKGAFYPVQEVIALWGADNLLAATIRELLPSFPHHSELWSTKASIPLLLLFIGSTLMQGRRFHPGYLLAGLAATSMGAFAFRNIGLYGIVVSGMTAVNFARARGRALQPRSPRAGTVEVDPMNGRGPAARAWGAVTVLVLVAATFYVATNRVYVGQELPRRFGFGISDVRIDPPVRRFIEEEIPPAPVLNTLGIGSAYLWWFYPERRPFIDGYGSGYPTSFYQSYREMVRGAVDVESVVERYGLEWALLEISNPLARRLMHDDAWHPVFLDGRAVVLVRRNERFADVIRKFDLRAELSRGEVPGWEPTPLPTVWTRTFPHVELILGPFLLQLAPPAAARVFEHATRVAPDLFNAWILLGRASLSSDRLGDARRSTERALEIEPDSAPAHALLARVALEQGDLDAAAGSARRATLLAPDEPRYRALLARVRSEARRPRLRALPGDPSALPDAGAAAADPVLPEPTP